MHKSRSPKQKKDKYLLKSDRLKAEIDELIAHLYNTNAKDTELRYENLKTYRIEVQRSFILYTHLAIEDLLRALLFDFLARQNRLMSKKQIIKTVDDMRSADLIHWCGRLRLITPRRYEQLLELNRIRNACAHNWLLDIPKYKRKAGGKSHRRIRVPVVKYHGKNLLGRDVFLDDFLPTYGGIYVSLLGTVWKIQGKI